MITSLEALDKELFLYLNGLGTESWDAFWLFITDKLYAIPLYAVLLVLLIKSQKRKELLITLLLVAVLITITDQTANLFKKVLVLRPRPCHTEDLKVLMRLVKKSCGGDYGYFSGHASNAMALATFISLILRKHYKFIPYILFTWAILVGYSRIYLGVHFPGDVLTGFCFGILYGTLLYKLQRFLVKKYVT